MRKDLWKKRMSKITAFGLSFILTFSPMVTSAEAQLGNNTNSGITSVSQGDVTPGDIPPWYVTPGDVTPGDVTPGDVTPGDVTPGDETPGDVTPGDVTPGDVIPATIEYYFPDENLAVTVAEYLEKNTTDEVSPEELNSIEYLNTKGVTDWQGVEMLQNLWSLYIGQSEGYNIEDLEGLKNTPHLYLYIGSSDSGYFETTMTGNINVFSDFVDLRGLSIWYPFSLTGELSSLPSSLEYLQLCEEGITGSLKDLVNMTNLVELGLFDCSQIGGSSISLLELPNLQSLALSGTKIEFDLSHIANLSQLVYLQLTDFNLTGDLEVLKDLTKLQVLILSENPELTGNLASLVKLTDLQALYLEDNHQITGDIALLANCSNLRYMGLLGTNVLGDIKNISGLTNLVMVSLNDSQVVGEISWLANMPLEGLFVGRTKVTGNLADLGMKESLRYINIPQTVIWVQPEDKELFPNLSPWDDIIVQPVIDTTNSQLTYQLGFPDQEGNHITIRTNKSNMGFEKLSIDGVEVSQNYDFTFEEVDEETHTMQGDLTIDSSYLEGLSAGGHVVTLDFYWGGSVSTIITIAGKPSFVISEIFPDDNFAASVAEALKREVTDSVTQDELDSLTELSFIGVTDWQGLAYLPNLHGVSIGRLDGYNIQSLAGLKDVKALELSLGWNGDWEETLIGDISVFSDFTDLRVLFTAGLSLTGDLSSLPDTLVVLNIRESGITGSLEDLKDMTNLEDLSLWGGQIDGSPTALEGLTKLTNLTLADTNVVVDLADFSKLTQLESLYLQGEKVMTGSLSNIAGLTNLKGFTCYWWSSQATGDIEVFKNFMNLETLIINGVQGITGDIANLSGLSELKYVNLFRTDVYGDTESIAGLMLQQVNLISTQVEGNIGDFAKMPLEILDLSETKVTGNLSDLGTKSNLTGLGISDTTIRVSAEDASLFENLETRDDLFVKPAIDTANSQLTYQLGFPDQEGNNITIRTNKSNIGFAKLSIDGVEVLENYTFAYSVMDEKTYTMQGDLTIDSSNLEGLSAGGHVVTLDFYWGGSVSTTITVAETLYTVQFIGLGGELIDEQKVALGRAAVAPTDLAKEGYTFTGWDTEFKNITADLVVRAQYNLNRYTVTFRDWDGTVLDAQIVDHGTAATAPEAPSREGYGFIGWDVAYDKVIKDLVVTAAYQANVFTVAFLDVDGEELEKQTVAYGKPATVPADPNRQGYEFIGWDKGFAAVTADMTVTAKYRVISGSSYVIDEPGNVDGTTLEEFGDIIIRSEGVTLVGGKLNGNLRVEAQKAVLKNLTIAGNVYLTAKDTTMSDSSIAGSLFASAESISLRYLSIKGNLSIGATNISLLGGMIGGNLTIERTVGDGHVEISGVTAKETIMYVLGGGSNSIIVADSVFGAIVVHKEAEAGQQAVRVAVEGITQVANTIVKSAAIIEDKTNEGDGIENVTLDKEIPAATTVELRGTIKAVTVQKEAIKVVNNAEVKILQLEAPSITVVNNKTVSELKVEKEAEKTIVEGDKINNIVVADGGEEPVYVPRPLTPNNNTGGKSETETPVEEETQEGAEIRSPETDDKDAKGFVWVAFGAVSVGCLAYRKLKRKESRDRNR